MSFYVILDIIALAIICLCVWRGKMNGLVKVVCQFLTYIGAFICARLFSGTLGEWINNQFLYNTVYSKIENALSSIDMTDNINAMKDAATEKFSYVIRLFNIDLNSIADGAVAKQESVIEGITEGVASSVSLGIANVLAFVLIFVIAFIVLKIVSRLLDSVARLPILNTFNKLGGIMIGAMKGVFVCWQMIACNVLNLAIANCKL